MANPQRENGHIDIANEIVDIFRRVRIAGEDWQTLWCVIRQTWGYLIPGTKEKKKFDNISLSQFVEWTGKKKSNIIGSLSKLTAHKFIIKKDNGKYGFNKNYDEWIPFKGHSIIQKDNAVPLSKRIPSKDNCTKDNCTKDTSSKDKGPAGASASKEQMFCNEIRNYWNSNAGNPSAHDSIPQIIALTPWRVEKLKARLKEHAFIKHWKEAIDKAMTSAFCRGKNDRGWKIDFSWFIENGNNYIKVLEGKYDDKQKPKGKYAHLEDKYEE